LLLPTRERILLDGRGLTAVTADPESPAFEGYRRLNDTRFRRRYEAEHGVFIAEGPKVVAHVASHAGSLVESLLVDSRMRDRVPPHLDVPVHVGDRAFLSAVVGFDSHRGMLALCARPPLSSLAHLAGLRSLV